MEMIGFTFISFIAWFIIIPVIFAVTRLFGFYAIVNEGTCRVYMLFGKVVAILDEPGFHVLPLMMSWRAFIVNYLGSVYTVDMRLDQQYLRSQAVNSEEGAPMGVGIWFEMFVSDPVSFLFKNTDPRGSLGANVSNAAVRCLSNMRLGDMLENRHSMSQAVRDEVSAKSKEWGYQLGSVYIRKVHFRDTTMIAQIEAKVVNRLRQVTSAIKQDGTNQVNIITSTAEKQAAVEFARAAAIRPQIVGSVLQKISADPEVSRTLFQVLEYQKLVASSAKITIIPEKSEPLRELLAARGIGRTGAA